MGKELRELDQVHKVASKFIDTGKFGWREAIEIAKKEVRFDENLDLDEGEIYVVKTGETIGEV